MAPFEDALGEAEALARLEDALRASPADQTELVLEAPRRAVTRFANNEIHQNTLARDTRVAVRVVMGQTSARAFTNRLDAAAIRDAISAAIDAARRQPANPRLVGLPAPQPPDGPPPPTLFAATAGQSPADRAAAIRLITERVAAAGFQAFGTAITELTELAIVNSLGVRAYAATSSAYLRALVDNGQGTGYADQLDRDVGRIDPVALAEEAIAKCRLNRDQIAVPPGDYACVLEPDCVADFVRFPTLYGLGGQAVEDGSSFMAGQFGAAVAGPAVTILDDPLHPRCLPLPIDYEGMPARPLTMIDQGIARAVAHSAATATRTGLATASNGHAGSPWEDGDPVPEHIVMPEGTASVAELTAGLRRGLVITRLHYTHCPDPKRVIATGTTRDGTFLVEDGQIVAAVKNLRFTQSVLELLSSIEATGRAKTCRDWWAANGMGTTAYYVPALRVARCAFTGVTTF